MNDHSNINIDTIEATEHLKNILNVGKNGDDSPKVKSISNGSMESAGDGTLMLQDRPFQKINLCANKESSHIAIYGTDVDIYSSPLEYEGSSSQVIVEDMVDYGWEEKYYNGNLISIHLSGLYLAYVLKPPNNKPGYVRLLRTQLDLRYLIKDYKCTVKDIAFAHTTSQVLLGSVDACGEFLVHQISDDGSAIKCTLTLRVLRPSDWLPSEYNRLIWCLYIPDDNDEENSPEDISSLLVVTHNERAEIWNIDTVTKEHSRGNITVEDVKIGVQIFPDHKTPISTATFSPDGTAVAVGSIDGVVKFFHVNTADNEKSPKCLHHWSPHPQKSLTSLYFLDNYQNHRPDEQFWKFAITGADNNTEVKLWSCETWSCLQTIRIHPNPDDTVVPCLKAEMDLSSRHLFLSDIKRKVVFILHTEQDSVSAGVKICSVSEYRVPFPVLSLTISNVYHKAGGKNSDDEGDPDQMGDIQSEADEAPYKYTIKLYWIQTKSLQSCRISYKPKVTSPLQSAGSISSLSQDSYVFKDGLSDISVDGRDTSARSVDLSIPKGLCSSDELSLSALPSHLSNYPKGGGEVLLTPDDFTSPSHTNLSTQNSFSLHEELSSSKGDVVSHLPDGIDSLPVEPGTLQRRKSSQHSATSSPSREVAEILAPTKVLHLDEVSHETSLVNNKDDEKALNNNVNNFTAAGDVRNQPDYHLKEWPQAPDPSKEFGTPARNDGDLQAHNQVYHSDNLNLPAYQRDMNIKINKMAQNFTDFAHKLECIITELRDQRSDLQNLQSDVKILRRDQKLAQASTKDNLLNKMDQLLTQNLVSHHSKLENLVAKSSEDGRMHSHQELGLMSDEISAAFGRKLESTLRSELSNTVLPQINRVLDAIGQKLQLDFNQKLTATDANLRESFTKHLKGKAFTDSLSQSLASSLHNTVHSTCKDVFQISVVPSFDKACQHLFQQLNEQFSKGISEYVQVLEQNTKKSSLAIEGTVAHMKEEIKSLTAALQQVSQAQTVKSENQSHDFMKQHEAMAADLRTAVQEEVRRCLREQTILQSRSTTPVPHSDPQLQKQQLVQLVNRGSLDEAFQQALSAMDVQLVLFLCEKVNVDQVFGTTPCPLQQHVLLSLVNQLSADLNTKTDIRVQYIEDVVASLDANNPITRDHLPGVLENLQHRLSTFITKNPGHRLGRTLRRISLAVNALVKA